MTHTIVNYLLDLREKIKKQPGVYTIKMNYKTMLFIDTLLDTNGKKLYDITDFNNLYNLVMHKEVKLIGVKVTFTDEIAPIDDFECSTCCIITDNFYTSYPYYGSKYNLNNPKVNLNSKD